MLVAFLFIHLSHSFHYNSNAQEAPNKKKKIIFRNSNIINIEKKKRNPQTLNISHKAIINKNLYLTRANKNLFRYKNFNKKYSAVMIQQLKQNQKRIQNHFCYRPT